MFKENKIWLSSPHMGGNEINYVKEAFETNWIAPLGPNVTGFESDIANYLGGGTFVSALSSGTAAIHLALIVLGVEKDDEVLCQSMTFSATANPIRYLGAIPIFIDSELETWNMSPIYLEDAIIDRLKNGKKPKAIIVVHLYGMPAKMEEILQIGERYEIPIIEDAAESLGSHIKNKMCGTFGEVGILSFNGNKIITTSGGGALISANKQNVIKATFLATQARDEAPHYEHTNIGYNYRLSNVSAGIGRGQMEVLDERVKKRRSNYDYYKIELSSIDKILFLNEPYGFFSNRWLTTIRINSDHKGILANKLREGLAKMNIECRPIWKPMHMQPVFSGFPYFGAEISKNIFQNGLCLPSGSNLQSSDILRVINGIKNLI